MTELIFHQYASSPFSGKVRLVFGYKDLDWKPMIMPKPDVIALSTYLLIVRRKDERAGTVHLHFPRIGFQVKKTKTK